MSLLPGTRLGPYEILATIGAGGMGEVYRARDLRLDRDVAIKTLAPTLSSDPRFEERFEREARVIASLNHPAICTVHDVGRVPRNESEASGVHFLVMEYLHGETLAARLERGRVPFDELLPWSLQIADALALAHERGIIHRDLKPANVFVTASGAVKVLDFGLAKLMEETVSRARGQASSASHAETMALTDPGTTLGTVAYMSPEQARGEPVDARSDVFSLGAVLYEVSAGRPAFTGSTTAVVFDRILREPVQPLRELAADAPAAFADCVDRMLAKRPSDRPAHAGVVAEALRAIRRDRSSGARVRARQANTRKSIVVLPFVDISASHDKDYFADGLTDELITDLSQIRTLRVISRNSSMQLKGRARDLGSIARDLGVQYVLEGTVRTAGDQLRVSAQLIDPVTDEHLWADKYAGTLDDIFEIQEQISRKIVDALKIRLSSDEDRRLSERPLSDVQAYEFYHRAYSELYSIGYTEHGLKRAEELIQQGLAVVGDNAVLHAALGTMYYTHVNRADTRAAGEGYLDKADACAHKALQIQLESAPALSVLGAVQYARGDRRRAIETMNRALAVEPSNLFGIVELRRIYNAAGDERHARAWTERYVTLDPLAPFARLARFDVELFFGDPEPLHDSTARYLEAVPGFSMLRFVHAVSLLYSGRRAEARDLLDAAGAEYLPDMPGRGCSFLRHLLAGRREEALASFPDDLKGAASLVEWWCWYLADCYALAGESDEALTWLEHAVRRGLINYPFLSERDRAFEPLRQQQRFQALMDRVKREWETFLRETDRNQ